MEIYLSRLPRIIRHVNLLLKDRGYTSPPYNEHIAFLEEALQRNCSIGEVLTCQVRKDSDVLNVVYLDPIFEITKGREVMTSSFQLYGSLADMQEGETALIISFAKLSPDASREAAKLKKKATVLHISSLAFPISQHVMIPRHTALSDEEAIRWEKEHKLSRFKLPVLKFTDVVRVWYGWKKGTIVKIDRKNCLAWRVVK